MERSSEMSFRSRLRVDPGMKLELDMMWPGASDVVAAWDRSEKDGYRE